MKRSRVLFVSSEPVGDRMAGPAIRSFELARAVGDHCEVTLAAPAPSAVGDADVRLLQAGLADFELLLGAARSHDVVVAERLPPQLLHRVSRLPVRLVADLYTPIVLEVLEAVRGKPARTQRRLQKLAVAAAVASCAAADFIICASERQRDLWLGVLAGHDLVDLASYRRDPGYRTVIDVVPFGMPAAPPRRRGGPVLKGVRPGVAPEDRVLVWGGGIWNWLDALTPIKAVERLAGEAPAIHLFFPGTARPVPLGEEEMAATRQAIEYARVRGLEGRRVHFAEQWRPYERRADYLLEADLGVSAHRDHLEARLSFRTRMLDYLWAELPVVATRGDTLADLVERQGLGRLAEQGDDEGFAAACRELLGDTERRRAAAEAIRRVGPSFHWSRVAEPLIEYCVDHARRPRRPKPHALLARATLGQYPRLLARAYEEQGPAELRDKLLRNARRAMRAGA